MGLVSCVAQYSLEETSSQLASWHVAQLKQVSTFDRIGGVVAGSISA